jgi:nicotinamide-nucleotide amidase
MQTEILASRIGELLLARGEWVATAESCSGGLISGALTDVAGSSAWFGFGFVTYSNDAKQALLGVSSQTLDTVGAVSERAVREMSEGALARAHADWAVAVSGIAGPAGGSAQKPVGTVWFALAGREAATEAFVCRFEGDRAAVRAQTVETALRHLLARLEASPLVV